MSSYHNGYFANENCPDLCKDNFPLIFEFNDTYVCSNDYDIGEELFFIIDECSLNSDAD